MKNKTPFPMTPFDMLVEPEHLHIMKLFLPYLPSGTQKILAVWIKYMELHNTLAYFRNFPHFGLGECLSPKQAGAMEIFEELRPYMKEDEAEQIDMALSAMSMMEMMNAAGPAEEHPGPADLLRSMMPSGTDDMLSLLFSAPSHSAFSVSDSTIRRGTSFGRSFSSSATTVK